MHPSKRWLYETRGKTTVEALKRNGFDAVYAEDAASARDAVLSMVPAGAVVVVGEDLGL